MKPILAGHTGLILAAMIATATPAALLAQAGDPGEIMATVYGEVPGDLSEMPEGPEIEGLIAARGADRIEVAAADGSRHAVMISPATEIRASGGFLGLDRASLGRDQLLNGLPVKVRTVQWGDSLIARRIAFRDKDRRMASMIRTGTDQRFAEQTAATDALRGRIGDIDQYNIKGTTEVYFDTGKADLSTQARVELCSAASQAEAMDNALLLVVGYTDSTGNDEINQALSERRAARVVNFLQQQCGWKPYRMLTPAGMAASDPAADNGSDYGRQQNRRVAVNILVSKSVDGF